MPLLSTNEVEATTGIEPVYAVLQTAARGAHSTTSHHIATTAESVTLGLSPSEWRTLGALVYGGTG